MLERKKKKERLVVFFTTIFSSFSFLIFEGVSDGKTFISNLLIVGCNLF